MPYFELRKMQTQWEGLRRDTNCQTDGWERQLWQRGFGLCELIKDEDKNNLPKPWELKMSRRATQIKMLTCRERWREPSFDNRLTLEKDTETPVLEDINVQRSFSFSSWHSWNLPWRQLCERWSLAVQMRWRHFLNARHFGVVTQGLWCLGWWLRTTWALLIHLVRNSTHM